MFFAKNLRCFLVIFLSFFGLEITASNCPNGDFRLRISPKDWKSERIIYS